MYITSYISLSKGYDVLKIYNMLYISDLLKIYNMLYY